MKFTISKSADIERVNIYLSKIDISKEWNISITLLKSKRSIDQNKLYWLWLGAAEKETGNYSNDLHEFFKEKFLGFTIKKVFGVEVKTINSTTKLNTKEFTEYLDKIHLFISEEIGLSLPYPEDRFFDQFCNEFNLNYK
jgi:hypothetical protein